MSTHIESKLEDISSVVLMPGDPKRCEYIARKFLANSKIVNNVRGMTAYTGFYKSKKITVFPSGMGCPSMGIYSYELYKFLGDRNHQMPSKKLKFLLDYVIPSYLPLILPNEKLENYNFNKNFSNDIWVNILTVIRSRLNNTGKNR